MVIGSHVATSPDAPLTVGRPVGARIDDAACTPEREGKCRHWFSPIGLANSVFECRRRVSSYGGLAQMYSWFAARAATVVHSRI